VLLQQAQMADAILRGAAREAITHAAG